MNSTLYIVIGVIAVIVVGVICYFSFKKSKKLKPNYVEEDKGEEIIEKIQLTAVVRLEGSSPINHKETDEEVLARLSAVSKDDFLALNVDEKPWSMKDWDSAESYEQIEARSQHELGMLYAYNHDGSVNETRAAILYREFVTKK